MKKLFAVLMAALLLAGCSSAPTAEELAEQGYVLNPTENGYVAQGALPESPRDTTKTFKPSKDAAETACTVDTYAPACSSIGVDNLYQYLNRDDVVYIDLRDYADYSKKHLRNFEVIPYFALIFDANAGEEGKPQLYSGDVTAPVATYKESDDLLHELFPQDKTIFLMCQSGGRVTNMMKLLAAKGYDMSKIYNVGGMGQYTASEYADYTVDAAEVTINAVYSFEDVTPVK